MFVTNLWRTLLYTSFPHVEHGIHIVACGVSFCDCLPPASAVPMVFERGGSIAEGTSLGGTVIVKK